MKRLIPIILTVTVLALPAWAARPRTATTFDAIMTHYEAIRVALLNDTTKDIASHAKEISALASAATKRFDAVTVGIDPARKDDCTSLLPKISEQANDLAAATGIGAVRDE